jgi:hypothetical protein
MQVPATLSPSSSCRLSLSWHAIGAVAGISFLISPITTILWVGGALLAMVAFLVLVVLYYAPRNSSAGACAVDDAGRANSTRRAHQLRNGWQDWEDSDVPMFEPFGPNIVEDYADRYVAESAFSPRFVPAQTSFATKVTLGMAWAREGACTPG